MHVISDYVAWICRVGAVPWLAVGPCLKHHFHFASLVSLSSTSSLLAGSRWSALTECRSWRKQLRVWRSVISTSILFQLLFFPHNVIQLYQHGSQNCHRLLFFKYSFIRSGTVQLGKYVCLRLRFPYVAQKFALDAAICLHIYKACVSVRNQVCIHCRSSIRLHVLALGALVHLWFICMFQSIRSPQATCDRFTQCSHSQRQSKVEQLMVFYGTSFLNTWSLLRLSAHFIQSFKHYWPLWHINKLNTCLNLYSVAILDLSSCLLSFTWNFFEHLFIYFSLCCFFFVFLMQLKKYIYFLILSVFLCLCRAPLRHRHKVPCVWMMLY